MKKDKKPDIVLKFGSWRTIVDEIAAFRIVKSTEYSEHYKVTVVLRSSGTELVEHLTREAMVEFGKAYVDRVNLKYGTSYEAFKETKDGE